jgi:hypothetical protein
MDTMVVTENAEPDGTLFTICEEDIHMLAEEEENPTLTACDV